MGKLARGSATAKRAGKHSAFCDYLYHGQIALFVANDSNVNKQVGRAVSESWGVGRDIRLEVLLHDHKYLLRER